MQDSSILRARMMNPPGILAALSAMHAPRKVLHRPPDQIINPPRSRVPGLCSQGPAQGRDLALQSGDNHILVAQGEAQCFVLVRQGLDLGVQLPGHGARRKTPAWREARRDCRLFGWHRVPRRWLQRGACAHGRGSFGVGVAREKVRAQLFEREPQGDRVPQGRLS